MHASCPTKRNRAASRAAACAGALLCSVMVLAASAQEGRHPRGARGGPGPSRAEHAGAPTNLKVLPKSLTGEQVRTVMEQWSAELGVRCVACHVGESDGVARVGAIQPRYADDSKPMEQASRLMYTMTVEINRKFIVGEDAAPGPVTCGMCHRGRVAPEAFVPPPEAQPFENQASSPDPPRIRH